MKAITILWRKGGFLALLAMVGSLALSSCGSDKVREGGYCDKTSDCASNLVCESHICTKKTSGDCTPACKPDVEACFNGKCVPIGNPDDKDGDGYKPPDDCNDFDANIHPGAHEYCDGIDNNCDGQTDEGCPPCPEGQIQPCGADIGECTTGIQTCTNGKWSPCSGNPPSLEKCDGMDNDCDGLTDEDCPCKDGDQYPCSVNAGTCSQGTQICENSKWSGCRNGQLPSPEICDGMDNDCDGVTDNGFGLGLPCMGVGECGAGVFECASDYDTRCSTMPGGSHDMSKPEICNNRDDDCDGLTDEGLEADTAPNTCPVAQDLGGLPNNGAEIKVPGNLWPAGDEDWYKVTATDDQTQVLQTQCDKFHFRIRFLQNPGNVVVDVYIGGCDGKNVDCLNDTEYDHAYDFHSIDSGQPRGMCECRIANTPDYNICAAAPKVFYVRVHGGQNFTYTCNNYQLSLSNGAPNP